MSGAWHWLLMALTLRRGTSGRARDRQDGPVHPQKASRAGGTLGEYREEGSQSLKDSPIQGQHRAPEQGGEEGSGDGRGHEVKIRVGDKDSKTQVSNEIGLV